MMTISQHCNVHRLLKMLYGYATGKEMSGSTDMSNKRGAGSLNQTTHTHFTLSVHRLLKMLYGYATGKEMSSSTDMGNKRGAGGLMGGGGPGLFGSLGGLLGMVSVGVFT